MIDLSSCSVVEAESSLSAHELQTPLVISSGSVTTLIELTATVRVTAGGRTAVGRGSICLSDLWAWPGADRPREAKLAAMIDYGRGIGASLRDRTGGPSHPLELGLRLHASVAADHDHPAPMLARSVSASPYDAALHDAVGQLVGRSAFSFYDEDAAIPSADRLFPGGTVRAVREALRPPRRELPGWWLIGMTDDLAAVGDQVRARGFRRFKLKLSGEPAADAARTVEIFRAAAGWTREPRLSVDTNEASPDPGAVLAYLEAVERDCPEAYARLDYLEQPTPRASFEEFDWHPVAARKPVLLDEGFTGLDQLEPARARGWSGLALKTCKGHSVALAAAAWARQRGLLITVQDLTNPGLAAIHSHLLAAHLDPINGLELNSPQYMPAANAAWLPRLSGLFAVRDGRHRLDPTTLTGLGSTL
ncbi:enolase C-terminal domain-like protein [Microlunatus sp. GCM10028923]|uniref:enolase C-terminal domain-like protein n=1 Tax=Microlunatus sp. GCM10028923 TaxID=3273400 RepID=UPI00360E174B